MQVILQSSGQKCQLEMSSENGQSSAFNKMDSHYNVGTLKVCTLRSRTGYRHHQSQLDDLLQSKLGTVTDRRLPLISRMPVSLIC
jgi:hypothetical protein